MVYVVESAGIKIRRKSRDKSENAFVPCTFPEECMVYCKLGLSLKKQVLAWLEECACFPCKHRKINGE